MTTPAAFEFAPLAASTRCPCLSGEQYGACCGPFHGGEAAAPTAERLMRSRYSAYVTGDAAYLLATWHPSTRPATLELDAARRFFRLDIIESRGGGMLDADGTVEFCAFSTLTTTDPGTGATTRTVDEQHEVSRFVRVDRRWAYLDGR
ncbi:YchJ family protein [Marisediminicola senii]|uniref:YchJ family protein n=1 Tax=Marisediminicola senii TaxID=2711233 RepID=UPI0013ECF63F|nr:YchJ family metal-binding protein [Marisediminicola senii]